MTLNLDPQIEERIVAAAKLEGIEPDEWVLQRIREHLTISSADDREQRRRIALLTEIMRDSEELDLYR